MIRLLAEHKMMFWFAMKAEERIGKKEIRAKCVYVCDHKCNIFMSLLC